MRIDLERLKAMRAESRTLPEIAEALSCSESTVLRYVKRLGLARAKAGSRPGSEYNENPKRWALAMAR